MKTLLTSIGALSAAFVGLVAGGPSWCQAFPVKPVRIVISGPPGTAPDVIARLIAQRLSESFAQPVIVDNRPGAGGMVAAKTTLGASADGYTVFLAASGGVSIAPFLAKKLPYDPVRDFAPVTLVVTAPLIVTMHPLLPVKSVKELIAFAKARPNQVFFASTGAGTVQHLTLEMLSVAAGIRVVHVPYKGGAPAVIDTMSGQVQLVITAIPAVLTQLKASRLRALAVTSGQRSPAVPDVPTIAESGLPGFESVTWYGMFVPGKTAAAIVNKLYDGVRNAAENASVKSAFIQEGVELGVNGPSALAALLLADIAKWQKVIREANIVLD
jgi:tripartite-type tricarboxylate transporter receptor subunit TctC